MYPISLKQITAERANVDKNNVPGTIKAADYNIEIAKFNCNLTPEGKEIGLFTFNNTDTKKQINMQVRGFPHGYGTAQTEITSDGTPTGGRLGKVSTKVVDSVMGLYNDARISSIRYFGTRPFENINEAMSKASKGPLKGILAINSDPLVSKDFNHNPHSSIFDLTQTQVIKGKFSRVLSWYDNEWGFSNRMCDTAIQIAGLI